MGLVYNTTTGRVEYLVDLEGGNGGGSSKQVTLLSITTAPSGTFEKGSQYYNSNTKLIYTAIDDNTWTGAKTSDPEFGTIYIYDNQGTTEYYQWDGDNLVETDLEKYQLVSNISNDYTESSKNKYPSSYALAKGLSTARPSKVTNSGTSLPATTGYQLGDTFLNTTDKKIYSTTNNAYILNTNVNAGNYLTINYQTCEVSGFRDANQYGSGYFSRSFNSCQWNGDHNYKIRFKLTQYRDNSYQGGLLTFYRSINYGNAQRVFGISNDKKIYYYESHSYQADQYVDNKILALDYEIKLNKNYDLLVVKSGTSCSVTLLENAVEVATDIIAITNFTESSNGYGIYLGYGIIERHYGNSIGQLTYGVINANPTYTTGNFFISDGSIIWDSGESLIDLSQYADITNGILYFYCENQLFSNLPKNLSFTNVSASTWVADNTYTDYGYKCDLSCSGVKANMFAQVIFNPTEADSGNYATVAQTGNNIITIYSKVNDTITIPNIVVMGV